VDLEDKDITLFEVIAMKHITALIDGSMLELEYGLKIAIMLIPHCKIVWLE
jgi:hypothetical protein